MFIAIHVLSKPTVEQLKTGTFEQRIEAIKYFGKIKYKKVFWDLVRYLNKDFKNKNLNSWSVKFRGHAAEALGRIGDKRAILHLLKRYKVESSLKVKRSIVYALSFYRSKDIIPVISNALISKDNDLRLEALHATAKSADYPLHDKVKSIKKTTRVYKIYLAACYTLVCLDSNAKFNYKQVQKGLAKTNPEYRFLAAYYLKKIGQTTAIEVIVKALEIENYYWVRKEMEDALAYLRFLKKKRKEIQKRNYLKFTP